MPSTKLVSSQTIYSKNSNSELKLTNNFKNSRLSCNQKHSISEKSKKTEMVQKQSIFFKLNYSCSDFYMHLVSEWIGFNVEILTNKEVIIRGTLVTVNSDGKIGLKNCIEFFPDSRFLKKVLICGSITDIKTISRLLFDKDFASINYSLMDSQSSNKPTRNYSDVVRGFSNNLIESKSEINDEKIKWNVNAEEFVPRFINETINSDPSNINSSLENFDLASYNEIINSGMLSSVFSSSDPNTSAAAMNIVAFATAAVIAAVYQNGMSPQLIDDKSKFVDENNPEQNVLTPVDLNKLVYDTLLNYYQQLQLNSQNNINEENLNTPTIDIIPVAPVNPFYSFVPISCQTPHNEGVKPFINEYYADGFPIISHLMPQTSPIPFDFIPNVPLVPISMQQTNLYCHTSNSSSISESIQTPNAQSNDSS